MSQQTEYEILLEEKREIDNRIDSLIGDMDVFPDVYEEYGTGNDEWSPRNETKVLWREKISGEIGKLKVRKQEINRKLGALKRQERPILEARGGSAVKNLKKMG